MAELRQSKCLNHADREAAARCPECRGYFCRECVTEHDGRLICASCLRQPEEVEERKSSSAFAGVGMALNAAFGLLVAWLVFYAVGQLLLMIPDSFHSGALSDSL